VGIFLGGLVVDAIHTFLVSFSITLIGFVLTYLFTKKPKLRFYYGAITQITIPTTQPVETQTPASPNNQPAVVRSHTIVVSNQGGATAHNIRIGHNWLPAGHSVSPALNTLNPGNRNEILVPTLCPNEMFTISYLYPITNHFSEINTYMKCDEGLAEVANIKHVSIKSSVLITVINCLCFIGVFSVIYFVIKILPFLYKLYLLAIS
jgi:hypothetical protein